MREAVPVPLRAEHIEMMRTLAVQEGFDPAEIASQITQERMSSREIWRNDRYTVHVERREEDRSVSELSIRRNDRKPIRDWRDFQRIKNEVAGAEVEAVELYPAMSRIMDTANQFYLWVLPPGQRFPLGYDLGRPNLRNHTPGAGSQQREVPEDWMAALAEHHEAWASGDYSHPGELEEEES
jgi:hypothetical protein